LALTKGTPNSTYFISPDQDYTYRDYIYIIGKELGRSKPHFSIPIPVVKKAVTLIKPFMNHGKRRTFLWQEDTMGYMLTGKFFLKR
jgi:hypothetical protein